MFELLILHCYCTIQLWRKVGGNNRYLWTIQWEICGNVLVDEYNFQRLNYGVNGEEIHWLRKEEPSSGSYYARRNGRQNGKRVEIEMAREVLRLPHGVWISYGVGEHKNHDIRENTEENLRDATQSQNCMNRVKQVSFSRFKGTIENQHGNKYHANIKVKRLHTSFTSVQTEVEAGLMYNYAADLVFGEHAYLNFIPEDEMPTLERQWELYDMVIAKLREKKVPFDESRIV